MSKEILFDKALDEIAKATSEIASKYNLNLISTKWAVTENDSMAVNFHLSKLEQIEQYRQWYELHSQKLGLEKKWIGKTFHYPIMGLDFTIVGLDEGSSEHFVVLQSNNDYFYVPPETVIEMLKE